MAVHCDNFTGILFSFLVVIKIIVGTFHYADRCFVVLVSFKSVAACSQ